MAADRKLKPLTVNMPASIRVGLQEIADREVLWLSDVIRRACMTEIARRDHDEARDGDDA